MGIDGCMDGWRGGYPANITRTCSGILQANTDVHVICNNPKRICDISQKNTKVPVMISNNTERICDGIRQYSKRTYPVFVPYNTEGTSTGI